MSRRRRRCKQLLMTLRKREDTGNRRRKHWIPLTGKLALDRLAVRLSDDDDDDDDDNDDDYTLPRGLQ